MNKEIAKEIPQEGDLELEKSLEKEFARLNIDPEQQESLWSFLTLIKHKDEETYKHSIRVALLGVKVAEFLKLDQKALFYPGLLHDTGKVEIPSEVLKKKGKFTSEDMEKMKPHSLYSYQLLKKIHPFSAEIALRHHYPAYPKDLPKSEINFSQETKNLIEKYAHLLSLIDFYDAAKNRTDAKFTPHLSSVNAPHFDKNARTKGAGFTKEPKKLTSEEVKTVLIENNQDQKDLILQLYQAEIFK